MVGIKYTRLFKEPSKKCRTLGKSRKKILTVICLILNTPQLWIFKSRNLNHEHMTDQTKVIKHKFAEQSERFLKKQKQKTPWGIKSLPNNKSNPVALRKVTSTGHCGG